MKRVILITGTPCIGKTTIAKQLAQKLGAEYINLTEFAKEQNVEFQEDKKRQTTIINEELMKQKLESTIQTLNNSSVIIDGHYAAAVTPIEVVSKVFVLRRNPKELKIFMLKRGYSDNKLWENLAAEILDSCLIEALQNQQGNVCEIDTTGKPAEEVSSEILKILADPKKCCFGVVDWLGMLEKEGLTERYLKD